MCSITKSSVLLLRCQVTEHITVYKDTLLVVSSYCVMSSRVVLYHVMSCRVVSCCITSCRVVLYHVVSYRVVSFRFVSCRVVLYHVVSFRVVLYHVMSCRIISCRVVSFRVVSYCVMLCRVVTSAYNIQHSNYQVFLSPMLETMLSFISFCKFNELRVYDSYKLCLNKVFVRGYFYLMNISNGKCSISDVHCRKPDCNLFKFQINGNG